MACSNPLRIKSKQFSKSSYAPEVACINSTFGFSNYYNVPCGYCLNCRVDKINAFTDRAEYEFCKYSCGAFVTFTYDDYHLYNGNAFFDHKSQKIRSSLNKKDCKDFLNRLNKLVHAERKKNGFNPLCRTDYKYLIVGEYGENGQVFDRCHYHALFFGLDFAFCERLFWKAWQYQGSIQVGAIQNGGIGYCLKYMDKQIFGKPAFYKYEYHGLQRPFQFHSNGFGQGLYKNQLKYIQEHNGNYLWRGHEKPVPTYYKNKFLIISDKSLKAMTKRYNDKKVSLLDKYGKKVSSFADMQRVSIEIAKNRQKQMEHKLLMKGKPVYNDSLIQKQIAEQIYGVNHLPKNHDSDLVKVITPQGNKYLQFSNGHYIKDKLTTRDLMKLHLDYNKFKKIYGFDMAEKYIQPDVIPF